MNTKFFRIYQSIIIFLCSVTILLFIFGEILSTLTEIGHDTYTIQYLMSISNSIIKIILYLLSLACATHTMVLLAISFKGEHSFLWLVIRQALPLVLPILLAFIITSFQQKDDAALVNLLIGIASGVISSIIILILDRNNTLREKVLKLTIPEYLNHTPRNKKGSPEKPASPSKKRTVRSKKTVRKNEKPIPLD